jgi:hypothetical protein
MIPQLATLRIDATDAAPIPLILAACLAGYVPSTTAASVDPTVALRAE